MRSSDMSEKYQSWSAAVNMLDPHKTLRIQHEGCLGLCWRRVLMVYCISSLREAAVTSVGAAVLKRLGRWDNVRSGCGRQTICVEHD